MIIDQQKLFPSQSDLLAQGYLESNDHWVICSPTGSGKTKMGLWAMERAIENGRKAAYIAPLRAIVEEKHTDWKLQLPQHKVGLFTGETTRKKSQARPRNEDILLFTPEKLHFYVQSWKNHLEWISQLDVLIIDEFHLLGDNSRGSSLESLIGRLKRINPFIRIIGLSATMYNTQELATWLKAKLFVSEWRPIPLKQSIVHFKKASQKYDLLFAEVTETLNNDGKVLVFVNSRKRAESLSLQLKEDGITADFNHAGLSRDRRLKTQQEMSQGQINVLVATSTLEMGVNFPARKVVIFDSYGFNGEVFAPITVQRYLQFSGRAGRPGYDQEGQSVLLLPIWAKNKPDYQNDPPEPISSGFFSTDNLQKEILCEISSRLAISEQHLEVNFASFTLWRHQGGKLDLSSNIQQLLKAGLIKRSGKEDEYLSVTPLGRVATQMGVSPRTIILLAQISHALQLPTSFDLLLSCCLTREVSPKLGFNFEEIDMMTDTLLQVPSFLLDQTVAEAKQLLKGIPEKSLLSAIKCASILYTHCQGVTTDELSEQYDCYPLDLELMKGNMGWILDTAQRIFAIIWTAEHRANVDEEESKELPPCPHTELCQILSKMVQYGIPREALQLTGIEGVGPKRAQALIKNEIYSVEDIFDREEDLPGILKLKSKTVEKILSSAEKVMKQTEDECDPFEKDRYIWLTLNPERARQQVNEFGDIDPYRLRRALELRVDHKSFESLKISGGAEPHVVEVVQVGKAKRSYKCDCQDFSKGHSNCKHIIRARLEFNDTDVLNLLEQLNSRSDRQLRFALGELWIGQGGLYDTYNDRKVDYKGNQFLNKTMSSPRKKR